MSAHSDLSPESAVAFGRSDARANRQRILQAARHVFGARGEDAEVREIADRAGVGLATVYRGFGNKEGLLTALAEQTQLDLMEIFLAAERKSRPAEQLHCLLVGAIDYVTGNGHLFDILAARFRHGAPDRLQHLHATLAGIIERGVASGDFRAELSLPAVVILLVGSLMAIAHSRADMPEVSGNDFADTVLELLAASGNAI